MEKIYKVVFIPCEGDIQMGILARKEYYASKILAMELGEGFVNHKEGRSYELWEYTLSNGVITS